MKPIIGIVAKHNLIDTIRPKIEISDEIKNAIFYNGGIAIGIIPSSQSISLVNQENEFETYKSLDKIFTKTEKDNLIAQIKLCDGIVLFGGKNSDDYEIWISKYCYENDIPIIGICAGHSNIVRSVGGRTRKVLNIELHNQPEIDYVHDINIDKSSKFFNFVRVSNMKVNSRHKNTISDPAKLKVSAYDEFGNIEVTEDATKKCFLGMRFHPESLYKFDEFHNNIFKEFIKICMLNKSK